jgi:RNA-directed DNA polymerase
MRDMMGRLKLTVNEEKTRLCSVPESSFQFLGYTFGQCYSARTGRATKPYRIAMGSRGSLTRIKDRMSCWRQHGAACSS